MKWLITSPGARWCSTTSAPRIAWQTTPIGSSTANKARWPRNGRRNQTSELAAITASPTNPVNRRLPYSITACESRGGTALP